MPYIKTFLWSAFGAKRPIVFVEGGRVFQIPDALLLDRGEFRKYVTYENAFRQHQEKQGQKLSNRVSDALFTLERRTEADKILHSDQVTIWKRNGENGECPSRSEPQLDRLFRLFKEVLPHISLSFEDNRSILVTRKGKCYHPSEMSDGEKQTLAILADIAMLADPQSLILVDEPELNLHPSLAARLWSVIEQEKPEAVFIYASHSIEFAMRPEVSKVIVISTNDNCIEIEDPEMFGKLELRPFLGAIPAILASDRVLIIEGTSNSFDILFYKWLTNNEINVVPVGSCNDVRATVNRDGVWQKLAPTIKLLGVIDRDYRTDENLARLSCEKCLVLEYHEAESYLCHPVLLEKIAARLGTLEHLPTQAELEEQIRKYCTEKLLITAAQRTFNRVSIRLNVSLHRKALAATSSEEQLIELIRKECINETQKAKNHLDSQFVEKAFKEEVKKCKRAVESDSIDEILGIFPGKELLEQLAPKVGCQNATQLALAVNRHLDPNDFVHLKHVRDRVLSFLGDGEKL